MTGGRFSWAAATSIVVLALLAGSPGVHPSLRAIGPTLDRDAASAGSSSAGPDLGEASGLVSVPVLVAPDAVAYDAANGEVYVADAGSNYVSVVNGTTNKLAATVPVGFDPADVVVDGENGDIYVENDASSNLTVIEGSDNRVVANIDIVEEPGDAVVDQKTGNVYVPSENGTMDVISGSDNLVSGTIQVGIGYSVVGGGPPTPVYDPANGDIYALGVGSNNATCGCATGEVSVIDGSNQAVLATDPVGQFPTAMAVAGASGDIYVSNAYSGTVTEISGHSDAVTATLTGFHAPTYLAYDAASGNLYVGDEGYTIFVIATGNNSVVTEIPIGPGVGPMAIDPAYDRLALVSSGSISTPAITTVISTATNSELTPVSVGRIYPVPRALTFDSATGNLYVTNSGSFNVSVIGPYAASFVPSGLAPGTSWSVTLVGSGGANLTLTSADRPITFLVSNGSYAYSVSVPGFYAAASGSGVVVVAGASLVHAVDYGWSPGVWTLVVGGSGFVLFGGFLAIRWRGRGVSPLRREYARMFHEDMHRRSR